MSEPRELERIPLPEGMPKSEWRELRRMGIGGSDAGAIIGASRYASPLDIYESKVNPQDDLDDSQFEIGGESEAAFHGTHLEDYVAWCFERKTFKSVATSNDLLIYRGNGFPMTANLDRVVIGEDALLECKTGGFFAKKDWANDGIPPAYLYQVLHYLEVTGWDTAYIAVLLGGQKFEYRTVHKSDYPLEMAMLIEAERDLWACVESETPPIEEF